MALPQESRQMAPESDLVRTLAGTNASAELRVARQTRRLVHGAVLNIRQRKSNSKRSLALVIIAIVAILIVLAPVIWNAVEHLIGQEHFGDVSTQMSLLLLFAFPALLAALLLMGKALPGERQGERKLKWQAHVSSFRRDRKL